MGGNGKMRKNKGKWGETGENWVKIEKLGKSREMGKEWKNLGKTWEKT